MRSLASSLADGVLADAVLCTVGEGVANTCI